MGRGYYLRTYNGFDGRMRKASIKPQSNAARTGQIPRFSKCCISGFSDPSDPRGKGYIFAHLEDYGRPVDIDAIYPLSRKVHPALHSRFTKPAWWRGIVRDHYVHGAWFTFLTMEEADMNRPFEQIYPLGIPPCDEVWPDVAEKLGLSLSLFDPSE